MAAYIFGIKFLFWTWVVYFVFVTALKIFAYVACMILKKPYPEFKKPWWWGPGPNS